MGALFMTFDTFGLLMYLTFFKSIYNFVEQHGPWSNDFHLGIENGEVKLNKSPCMFILRQLQMHISTEVAIISMTSPPAGYLGVSHQLWRREEH